MEYIECQVSDFHMVRQRYDGLSDKYFLFWKIQTYFNVYLWFSSKKDEKYLKGR